MRSKSSTRQREYRSLRFAPANEKRWLARDAMSVCLAVGSPTMAAKKKRKATKPAKAKKVPKRAKATKRAAKPVQMFQKVAFTMFGVKDATRARAFYEDVLGLKRGL